MINISKLYCGLAGASDHLRYNRQKANKPIAVFNCTKRCNLKCIHCYSLSDEDSGSDQMNTDQAKNLITQLAKYGCPVLLFSGGEPLLRKDLFELMNFARDLGLKTVLSTNGTLIDMPTAIKLSGLGLSYAGISLDGPEQQHSKFRGIENAFNVTIQGIANCRKAGIKTGLRFTMTKYNVNFIKDIFDIAEVSGIRRICFYHLIRTGRAQSMNSGVLNSEQTRNALDVIIEQTRSFVDDDLVDEVLTVGNHADGPYLIVQMQREDHPLTGQALNFLLSGKGNRIGQNIASINWDGNVYPDQFWRNYSLGNVTEKTFKEIWDNHDDPVLKILRNKNGFKDPRCAKCKWFDTCQGNFRFTGSDAGLENWKNEPQCYLTDYEIGIS